MKFLAIRLILFSLLLVACVADKKEKIEDQINTSSSSTECSNYIKKNKINNLNISLFLDLSDRILDKNTIIKDSSYLSELANVFIEHVKRKRLILLEDKMQLFFNPEPADPAINDIANNLQIHFTRNTTKEELNKTLSLYQTLPIKIYKKAVAGSGEKNKYPGSDIWRFFKDNVKDYCIDDCHRNILVILTDGYMYHENSVMKEKNKLSYLTPKTLSSLKLNSSNWNQKINEKGFGFLPLDKNFKDLEVLVIGINNKNPDNPYALDIMKTFWENWFKDMGIENYKIKKTDLPVNIKKVIQNFITNKS